MQAADGARHGEKLNLYTNRLKMKKRSRNGLDWLIHYAWAQTLYDIERAYYQYLNGVLGFGNNWRIYNMAKRPSRWDYDLSAENEFIYEEDIRLALYRNIQATAVKWGWNTDKDKRVIVHGQHQIKIGKEIVFPDLLIWRRRRRGNKTCSESFEKACIEIKLADYKPKEWGWMKRDLSKLNRMVQRHICDSCYFFCLATEEIVRTQAKDYLKKYKKGKQIETYVAIPKYVHLCLPKDPYFLMGFEDRAAGCVLHIIKNNIERDDIQNFTKRLPKHSVINPGHTYGIPWFSVRKMGKIDSIFIAKLGGRYVCMCEVDKNLDDKTIERLDKRGDVSLGWNYKKELFDYETSTYKRYVVLGTKRRVSRIEDCITLADDALRNLPGVAKIVNGW